MEIYRTEGQITAILSALQPWVSLGLLNNQSPLLSIFRLLHPLLYLHYFQVCYNIIHPSQAKSSFSSSYERSSFHHLSLHCSHFHSVYMPQPSQARSSFSSSYERSSFHHLSLHCSHFHSVYISQPSYPLSFYKFRNILSVYGFIQFFIISNSPNIPLLDRPIDLSQYFPFENP